MSELTHLDEQGRARMVEVSAKPETVRVAVAGCSLRMETATWELLRSGQVPKGDALAAARLAGIMAAKRTSELIPLCHPLALTGAEVTLSFPEPGRVDLEATVKCVGKTGVEMEALTAAAVASLTLYDMLKAVDRGMVTTDLRLLHKSGGRSGDWQRP